MPILFKQNLCNVLNKMIPNLATYYHSANGKIQKVWISKFGIYKLTTAIFMLFLVIYFPEIILKRISGNWSSNDIIVQNFVNFKIKSPFTPYLSAEKWDHFSKRDLRITPYLIAHFLNLEAIKLFYFQALVIFPIFILFALKIIYQFTADRICAFWGTIALLFTYVGNSFQYDTFFYDSFAYTGLLLAVYLRKNWLVIPVLISTFFVDERSIIPASLIVLLNYFSVEIAKKKSLKVQFANLFLKNPTCWFYLIAVGIYCLGRFEMYQYFQLSTPIGKNAGVTIGLAFIHKLKVPFALFSAFKWNYILIIITLNQLLKTKEILITLSYSIALVLIFVTATAVEDVTRSLGFGFLLFFTFYQLVKSQQVDLVKTRIFLTCIAIGNLLLPTYTLLLNLYQIPILGWLNLLS